MSLYYFGNARTAEQLSDMRRLDAAGICVFCPEHLSSDPYQRIAHRTDHWTITPNLFPYTQARVHYLLVPDEHVIDMADLSAEARADFWSALEWAKKHCGLDFYGLAARNGESQFTGGTVSHLHIHLLQGDVDAPGHEGVRVRLSSRPPEFDPDQLDAGRG